MSSKLFSILIVVIGIISLSACTAQISQYQTTTTIDTNAIPASLGSQFQLKVNQVAVIQNENLKIKFLDITGDSRCPSDVICVWEGQATGEINVMKNNQDIGNFNLTSRAGAQDGQTTVQGYSITLVNVQPYPLSTHQIGQSDYVISLIVSKV